ncbi:MAG: UDP-3-O-(3-hydroxymyristoyl)glucosamine N-acyltransferase [Fimbriimonadaceae bacterium]
METQVRGWTLGEIAALIGGELVGPADLPIARAVPAGYDDPEAVTFAESEKYLAACLASKVGAVIVKTGTPAIGRPAIFVESPRAAFGYLLARMARPLPLAPGLHAKAIVSPDSHYDASASVGAFAVIERGAKIGADCRIYPFAYVGENCILGDGCIVFPHAVLYQDVVLGARCVVHSGAVIGADGFGFVWDGDKHTKVPQVGGVVIGDDVEIGANSCIDRATCGETTVGNGTKFDNLVQIGHNVSVGTDTVLAAQVGVGGSTTIGNKVTIGGDAVVSDHIAIADEVVLGGRSAAFQDIEEAGQYFGLPPLPIATAMRVIALQARLPELFRRLKSLEDEVEALRRNG